MRQYSQIAIFLHWTIAILLGFQISLGWLLDDLGARGFALYQLHKTIGISILVLTLVRIGVRAWKPRAPHFEGGWQGALASGVHFGLYAFMLGAPLTGWALVSTAPVKVPTLLFGVIPLPHLPLPVSSHDAAVSAHALLALLGIALFLLHVAGALRHHILLRDGLLWRMMPARSRVLLVLLPLLVLAGVPLGQALAPAVEEAAEAPAATEEAADADQPIEQAVAANAAVANAIAENAADNALAAAEEALPPPAWKVQPGGKLGFAVGNDGQTINGSFSKWTARIVMDPERPETADIQVDIDLASASVGDAYQDGMLPGDEFFGVAAHPTARFRAEGAESTGAGSYRASGTLTLRGISRPQTIRFKLSGSGKARKVTGSATVERKAFNVGNGGSSNGLAPRVSVNFAFDARSE